MTRSVIASMRLIAILMCVVVGLSSCGSARTSMQQTWSGNPVAHDMGGGVTCYTYESGLSCLQSR